MKNLTEMYLELRDPIYRYLLRLSGDYNLAEELTQETFFQAILALPRFRKEASAKTWLFAIARNVYLRKIRGKNRISFLTEEIQEPTACAQTDPQACLEKDEQDKTIAMALDELPEIYRTVVILRACENLSYAEIAVIFGKTENWVRVTFFRAKQLLRASYLKLEGGEED